MVRNPWKAESVIHPLPCMSPYWDHSHVGSLEPASHMQPAMSATAPQAAMGKILINVPAMRHLHAMLRHSSRRWLPACLVLSLDIWEWLRAQRALMLPWRLM